MDNEDPQGMAMTRRFSWVVKAHVSFNKPSVKYCRTHEPGWKPDVVSHATYSIRLRIYNYVTTLGWKQ